MVCLDLACPFPWILYVYSGSGLGRTEHKARSASDVMLGGSYLPQPCLLFLTAVSATCSHCNEYKSGGFYNLYTIYLLDLAGVFEVAGTSVASERDRALRGPDRGTFRDLGPYR